MIENLPDLFERPNKKTAREKESEEKYDDALKTLGMMKIENEFLKKKYLSNEVATNYIDTEGIDVLYKIRGGTIFFL